MSLATATDEQTQLLLAELKSWSEQGWIRRLDCAFAGLVVDLCPTSPAPVVMAAALLAHVEGRGHSCLLLDHLLDDSSALLGLAPPAADALQRLMSRLPSTLAEWLAVLRASPLVRLDVRLDADPPGKPDAAADVVPQVGRDAESSDNGQPLVLRGSKLYLRRYWHYEQVVAAQVLQRAGESLRPVDGNLLRSWLDRLFPPSSQPRPDATDADFDWQKAACGLALAGNLTVITGGPGTGKTYTAARLLALLFAVDPAPQRLRIALAAPTGKAAARLRQAIADALLPLQEALGDDLPLATLAANIGPARTLHSLLGARPDTRRFAHCAAHPLEVDVLIVDEASMIHLEMMAALFDALPPGARVILLGDKDQLASVEAGAVLGDLCRDAELGRYRAATAALLTELTGDDLAEQFFDPQGPALAQHTVMLRSSRRFSGPIGQLALAVNRGDQSAAAALLQSPPDGSLHWIDAASTAPLVRLAAGGGKSGAETGYRNYLGLLKQRPSVDADQAVFGAWVGSVLKAFERFRILCAVRDGDWGADALNLAIERVLLADATISKRAGNWYQGRPIMVTRNDAGLGVFNGDIGIVLRPFSSNGGVTPTASGQPALRAFFADSDNSYRSVAISRLAHVETAFAMTVHKAQGSEFDHCVLVLPQAASRVSTRELVYTGITRARSAFTLVTGRRQALGEALGRRTQRSSGLLELLQRSEDSRP